MKKGLTIMLLAAALLLSGCASVPDLADSERDLEAEYMAGVILRHNKNSGDMLDYDRKILEPTPKPAATRKPLAKPDPADAKGGSSQQGEEGPALSYVPVRKIWRGGKISITQQTYELRQSYGTSYATIDAHKKNRLLVVRFRVRNASRSAKRLNLGDRGLVYSLSVDGSGMGSPLQTILDNDMQFLNMKLGAGRSKEAVLVFEVKASTKLKNAELTVIDGNRAAKVSLR